VKKVQIAMAAARREFAMPMTAQMSMLRSAFMLAALLQRSPPRVFATARVPFEGMLVVLSDYCLNSAAGTSFWGNSDEPSSATIRTCLPMVCSAAMRVQSIRHSLPLASSLSLKQALSRVSMSLAA